MRSVLSILLPVSVCQALCAQKKRWKKEALPVPWVVHGLSLGMTKHTRVRRSGVPGVVSPHLPCTAIPSVTVTTDINSPQPGFSRSHCCDACLLRGCDSHLRLANSVAVPFKCVGCECCILSCLSEREEQEGDTIPACPTGVCVCVRARTCERMCVFPSSSRWRRRCRLQAVGLLQYAVAPSVRSRGGRREGVGG